MSSRPTRSTARDLGIADPRLRGRIKAAEHPPCNALRRMHARIWPDFVARYGIFGWSRRSHNGCDGLLRPGQPMSSRFEFIRAQKASCPVWLLCRVLRVSMSGFCAWSRPERDQTSTAPSELDCRLPWAFMASRARYGGRRLRQLLQPEFGFSRATVARRMRALEPAQFTSRPDLETPTRCLTALTECPFS